MSCDCTGQCRKPPFTCNGLPVAVRTVVEWLFMSEAPSVEDPVTIARITAELVEARGAIDGATRVVRRAINKLLTDARDRSMTREESGALDALRQLEIDVAAHARTALEPKP